MQLRTLTIALVSMFGLVVGAAWTQPQPERAAPAAASEPEAAQFCLPRQCGPVPICLANSVARCSPETNCHWECVPLNGPI